MTTDATQTQGETGTDQIGAVQPVAISQIDWTALEAKLKEQRAAAVAARKLERGTLLAAMRDKSVTTVEARYDGYSDSGNVGEIALTPKAAPLGDLEIRLSDFIWGMAYDLHPGFENNDGGEGSFLWDIAADRIDIEHANFYTERDEHMHEDI